MAEPGDLTAGSPFAPGAELPDDATARQGLTHKPLSVRRLAWLRFRQHKLALVSGAVLAALVVLVVFPSLLTDWAPLERDTAADQYAGPSGAHWLGTDDLRRDMLARVLYGGRVSLLVGLTVAIASALIGAAIGALAGFLGGWVDNALMRITDLFIGLPQIVMLIVLTRLPQRNEWSATLMGGAGSVRSVITVMTLLFWMPMARVVRGLTMSLKEKEFVEAARALGMTNRRIVSRHVLPNCVGAIIVSITIAVAVAILAESALSFLGFGVQSVTTPTWGNMLANTKGQLRAHGHIVWFPGLAIVLTVLCVNYLGDGLRDALDPRQRRR